MSHLLLARHGQSVSNAIRRFQGSQDVELSDLGVRQAEALARVVRSRPVTAIYTSPLARARRTAEIAAAGTDVPVIGSSSRNGADEPQAWQFELSGKAARRELSGSTVRQVPVHVVEDLRELCLGEWEGRTVEEVRSLPGDPYAQWVRDPVACLPPGGEPLPDVQDRVVRAMEEIARAHPNGQQVLVVCHGGVISAYLAHCLGLPLSSIWRLTVSNGSLTEVRPPRVHSVNSTRHLNVVLRGAAEGEPRAELMVRGAAEGEPRAESDIALGYPTPTSRAP
jgi:broad specificity phosphatase PhoE